MRMRRRDLRQVGGVLPGWAFRPAAIVIGLLVAWFACSAAAAAEGKRVMLLHSFGQGFKPWSEYASSIRGELYRQSPWPLDIIDQSLVTARSGDDDAEAAFVD